MNKCKCTHHEHTPGAVGRHLWCGIRGAVGGLVPCSRAPRRGIEGGESAVHSLPSSTIPAGLELTTFRLWVWLSTITTLVRKQKHIKAISRVHLNMKMLLLLVTLKLFQTCMRFFLLLNIKEDILRHFGYQFLIPSVFHSNFMEVWYYGSQWLPSTVWLPTSLK